MPSDWVRFGAVRVLPLLDAVVEYPWPLPNLFPGPAEEAWDPFRERYPAAFSPSDLWHSSYSCYLLRSEGRTLLMDTGMGVDGPLAEFFGRGGTLTAELDAAGVAPEEVDAVVLSHLHPDHVGGNFRDGQLAFPNARYVVPRADWVAFHTAEVQAHLPFAYIERDVTPLERLGALELIDGEHALTAELTVAPAPGHTPGHSILRIESGGERAVLIADTLLHLAQVTEPDWSSRLDLDPERARSTRHELLDMLERERIVFSGSHFPQPAFGRIERENGSRYWVPLS